MDSSAQGCSDDFDSKQSDLLEYVNCNSELGVTVLAYTAVNKATNIEYRTPVHCIHYSVGRKRNTIMLKEV